MSGDEILRAVMSENYISCRPKIYTIDVLIASTVAANTPVSAFNNFGSSRWFLLTKVLVFYAVGNTTGAGFVVTTTKPDYTLQLTNAKSGKQLFSTTSDPGQASGLGIKNILLPQSINASSDWTIYELFEPNTQIQATVIPRVSQDQGFFISLYGIEYKYPEPS